MRGVTFGLLSSFYGRFSGYSPAKEKQAYGQISQKEGIIIIQISKEEALRLNKDYKVKFNAYGGISTTHSKRKRYFLTESTENLNLLRRIRRKLDEAVRVDSAKKSRVGV